MGWDFYDNLRKGGASPDTVREVMIILKASVTLAHCRGMVAQNVLASIKIEKVVRKQKEIGVDIPTKEEMTRILQSAPPRWRAFLVTAAFTGMRPGELRALTWRDIDFHNRVVKVRRGADHSGRIDAPKTLAGIREIPILDIVYSTLRQWSETVREPVALWGRHLNEGRLARDYGRLPEKPVMKAKAYHFYQRWFDLLEKLAANGKWEEIRKFDYPARANSRNTSSYVMRLHEYRDHLLAAHDCCTKEGGNVVNLIALKPDDLVFANAAGKVFHLYTLQEAFSAAQYAAGIEGAERDPQKPNKHRGRYSLYALRHFFASWLIDSGDRPEQVKGNHGS
jgi:integrase